MGPENAHDLTIVDGFVSRHFRLRGTLRLHRNAIGWDLLRAPGNVALAPVFLLTRLVSITASCVGLRRAAQALDARRFQFRSRVGATVEAALLSEVIVPRNAGRDVPTPAQLRLVEDYIAVRSAVSEISTLIAVIVIGLAAFQVVTPGVLSLTPVVTERAAHAREIAAFPFGQWLGGAWYSVFPGERPLWQLVAVGTGLVFTFSLVTTFAGLVADPLQARLGIHRRRLLGLLKRIDRHARPRIEGEFLLARGADITDTAALILRLLRP